MQAQMAVASRSLALLAEPLRRRMYLFIRASQTPVSREQAAAHAGIAAKLAAFHLDKLVDCGLLEASYGKPVGTEGRRGRSSKLYRASPQELSVIVPERRYDLLARTLAQAVEERFPGESVEGAARRLARTRGHEVGSRAATSGSPEERLEAVLGRGGFEPWRDDQGVIHMSNCPFESVARSSPGLICGMNRAFVEGLVDGLGLDPSRVQAQPDQNGCCVRVSEDLRA